MTDVRIEKDIVEGQRDQRGKERVEFSKKLSNRRYF